MNEVVKKWWFWAILSITIIILTIVIFYRPTNNINYKNEGVGSAGISKKEFNSLELGLTETKVLRIIDSDGLLEDDNLYNEIIIEQSKSSENHIYKYSRKVLGEDGGYAILTFIADYSNGDLFVMPTLSEKLDFDLK